MCRQRKSAYNCDSLAVTCRLFPCHPTPRACHWTGQVFHGRRLSPPGTPFRRPPPSATRTPPHAPAAQTAVWCHAHRHMNPGIGYNPGTVIVQRNVMAERELPMRLTGTNDTGIQSRRPTWSSLKTLPAIAEANAMPSAARLHLRCSSCACATTCVCCQQETASENLWPHLSWAP